MFLIFLKYPVLAAAPDSLSILFPCLIYPSLPYIIHEYSSSISFTCKSLFSMQEVFTILPVIPQLPTFILYFLSFVFFLCFFKTPHNLCSSHIYTFFYLKSPVLAAAPDNPTICGLPFFPLFLYSPFPLFNFIGYLFINTFNISVEHSIYNTLYTSN